jgi:hypothetical protein
VYREEEQRTEFVCVRVIVVVVVVVVVVVERL